MTRLPPALRPLWPAARNVHRVASRAGRHVGRLTAGSSPQAVPTQATLTSRETAAAEPDHVRFHLLPPRPTPPRENPIGGPGPLAFWTEVNVAPSDERYVLEVAAGRLVGEFAATVTPGGRLDVETSPYWGRDWREHPIFIRPRLPETSVVDGTVLSMASAGSSRNFYHSLLDALPRWGLATEAFPGLKPDAIVIGHTSPWDRQLVSLLGLDDYTLITPTPTTIQANRLIVPSMGNSEALTPRWITEWLRAALPPRDVRDRPRRIFVSRGNRPRTRRYVQEQALLEQLRPLGFASFDPGAHSVQDQIDTFAAAEVVVAPHGAGLANLNFSPAGVRVLELFAPTYINPAFWTITTNIADSHYRYLTGEPADLDRPARKMLGVQHDVDIPATRVLEAIEELLAL